TTRNITLPDTSTWKEPMLPYYPQYMFCGVENGKSGLAVFNIGLPEYAVHDDRERTIGLTLLRTYRFPIIGADPEDTATDETQTMCQCLRKFIFNYAIYPYAGSWQMGEVFQYANRFNLPLKLYQCGRSTGTLPSTLSFIQIEPGHLILSAVKKSSLSNGLIIRVFNPSEETVQGGIRFFRRIREASIVNLNEKVLKKADYNEDTIRVTAGSNKIITFEVLLEEVYPISLP
ncbi:MAG: glycosyl hydrolase-related protein, partial [Spirochaetota bacterium]